MITKAVNLWLGSGPRVVIPVSQFDTMWQFVFTVIKDSTEWTIPTGASAVLNGLKPDGNVFAFSGTISGNTVTVDCDVQMTAVAGDTICELSIFTTEGSEESQRAKVVGTANFVLAVEAAPNSTGATPSASNVDAYGAIISGELDTYFEQHPEMIEGKGLSEPIRLAILDCFQHVAWIDEHGSDYYNTLYELLMTKNVLSITVVFEQGSAVIYDTDTLDTLKQYLTVTANYDDGTSAVVTGYTLSGTLTVGTSTITVNYGGKTATFTVTVTHDLVPSSYQRVEWIGNTERAWIQPSNQLPSAFRIEAKTKIDGYNSNAAYGNIAAAFQPGASTYGMEFAYKKEDNTIIMFLGAQSVVTPADINDVLTLGAVCTGSKVTVYQVVNGERVYGTEQSVTRDYTNSNYGIFYAGTSSSSFNQFVGRIYWLELYDSNDNLIAEYLPCYRKSDGVIGMYETVGGVFYTNNGSGSFTKGSDV